MRETFDQLADNDLDLVWDIFLAALASCLHLEQRKASREFRSRFGDASASTPVRWRREVGEQAV